MITFFEQNNWLSWMVTFVIVGLIFWISSLEFGVGAGGISLISILYHFFAFFFLASFLLISLVKGREVYGIFFLGVFIAVLYGVSDEIHQYFVPGRCCSVKDIFVDSSGVVLSSMIYLISIRHRKLKNFINSN